MSVGNALEMRPSGRNQGPTAVVIDESSKSSSCDDGKEWEEQVGEHLVANEKATETRAENVSHIDKFGRNG